MRHGIGCPSASRGAARGSDAFKADAHNFRHWRKLFVQRTNNDQMHQQRALPLIVSSRQCSSHANASDYSLFRRIHFLLSSVVRLAYHSFRARSYFICCRWLARSAVGCVSPIRGFVRYFECASAATHTIACNLLLVVCCCCGCLSLVRARSDPHDDRVVCVAAFTNAFAMRVFPPAGNSSSHHYYYLNGFFFSVRLSSIR